MAKPSPANALAITIYGELRSSKNTGRIFLNKKTGKMTFGYNKKVKQQESDFAIQLNANRNKWKKIIDKKPFPLRVSFFVYRQTKRKWDWMNIIQGIADSMTKAGYFPDDDAIHFTPVFNGFDYDKTNPRCEINILW